MSAGFAPGPWHVCQHLRSVECDADCGCGYRGVIYGGDDDLAICQPGHEPAPKGQEGSEPGRYPREVEIANANLIAAAPDLYDALRKCLLAGVLDLPEIMAADAALCKARGEA